MKKLRILLLLLASVASLSVYDDYYEWQTDYSPVLLSREDLKSSITSQQPREFSRPGKIYLYEQLIFIVDKYEGVHVIDNSQPQLPVKRGFIRIPGCIDVAVQNDVLFADNAVDLVSIDIAGYPEIEEIDRFRDVFPEHTPPDFDQIPSRFSFRVRPRNTVIVDWELVARAND